jgi:hypothetical protein
MDLALTSEQLQALSLDRGTPIRLVDPNSQRAYVLVPADQYERLLALEKDDYQLSDTYVAQMRSAMRAGWDDPAMDDYNNYEENYRKLCQ